MSADAADITQQEPAAAIHAAPRRVVILSAENMQNLLCNAKRGDQASFHRSAPGVSLPPQAFRTMFVTGSYALPRPCLPHHARDAPIKRHEFACRAMQCGPAIAGTLQVEAHAVESPTAFGAVR